MIRLPPPTLTRRVVVTMLVAMPLTWLALLTFIYAETRFRERTNPALVDGCAQMVDAFGLAANADEARQAAVLFDRVVQGATRRRNRPAEVMFQIQDRLTQTVVYASPTLSGTVLSGDVNRQTRQDHQGETIEVVSCETQQWLLSLAQTRIDGAWLLKTNAGELAKYLLIAVPFVLLPVWLSVRRGLRPLHQFSDRIAARSADDLSPIGFKPEHAELKPIVTALDGLLTQLKHKLERERAFVQDAAHELRTPMAVIAAQAHVLAKAESDLERGEATHHMEAAIKRASHLIHQLLVLARLDVDRPVELENNDLAHLARQSLANFDSMADARNIELTLEAPDQLRRSIDTVAFQTVLNNLIDNAIRYGRDGGRVRVDLSARGRGWCMSVADDGPGIAAGERDRVFDRFFRGAGHYVSGTGLGLAIVRQAATHLSAEVKLSSGLEGEGCEFSVVTYKT